MAVLREFDRAIEDIFKRNTPSVVYISTFTQRASPLDLNAYIEIPQGTGSGFAWDSDGHVVTNWHVIRNAQEAKVTVTSEGGKRLIYDARIVGANPDKDVAVLQLLPPPGHGLKGVRTVPVAVGTSSDLHVGQIVFAIGNPYGLDHTLTMGIVSGLNREMISPSGRPISNVIQTDAAINPGNSGGVLLDIDGRVIAMNTAIYSSTGTNTGIGFAIPVDTLRAQVSSIIEKVLTDAHLYL
ncbi:trypsin-like cysteine/serine peptidase domain-containing protein [Pavlovales sp. CCMP2436]|nr:trypsin-like cysteine/serine peptidase domain-containing protein [Pavlovales sp. CCMP2436]